MHFIYSIIMGIIAGFIASKIVNKTGSGILLDLILGVVGSVVGGFLSDRLGLGGAEGYGTIWFLFVSVVGAIVVLLIYRAISKSA